MYQIPVLRVCARLRLKSLEILRHLPLLTAVVAGAGAGAQVLQPVQHLPGSFAVHPTSAAQPVPVNVTITASGTVASIRVVTQGETGLDFQYAAGGSCTSQSYLAGSMCTVDVTVSPTSPGRRRGAVLLLDSANRVLASRAIDAAATGPLAVVRNGAVTTVAGISNDWRYRPADDGHPAVLATIYLPQGVVADDAGTFYISDTINARIRKVAFDPAHPGDPASAIITTYAGIGYPSNIGDNGPATGAGVNTPTGLALDGAGNLFIADSGNNTVRRVDAISGVITTIAGQDTASGFGGDGLPATAATLANPNGLAFDADGNLYIADTGNNAIRRVDTNGFISTVVGGPTATGNDGGPALTASLNGPWTIAFGPTGLLYIADLTNNAVRQVDANGIIHTVAGTKGVSGFDGDGAAATLAHLKGPAAVALDAVGNLYIADSANNRVRRVDAGTGYINTVVGNGGTSYLDNVYDADDASLYGPYALSLDGNANLFIADYFHNIVRRLSSNSTDLQYPTMRVSKTSDPQTVTVENDGNATLTPGASDFNMAALDPATTTCATSVTTVAPGATCNLGAEFAPTMTGSSVQGLLTFHSDGANAPDLITLFGEVLTVEPTQTTLTSSLNPAAVAQSVTFTATVSETQGTAIPTGTVTFLDGASPLGPAVTLSDNGIATFTTSTLGLGSHTITASYGGDANDAAEVSQPVTESILQSTQISVASSLNPSAVLQDVTFTATLSASTPVTSGVITFLDGGVAIGTGNLAANGANSIASFTAHGLSGGSHLITASFPGNSSSLTSSSPTLLQTVNRAGTGTLLSANPSTAAVGVGVTLTASVTSHGGPTPTGNVTFKSSTTTLGTGTLDASGNAQLTTTALPPGVDAVTAVFGGDSSNVTSTSPSINVTVMRLATITTLASSTGTANAGSTLQLTANVALGPGQTAVGTLAGLVTFYDGATVIGTGNVINGSAVLPTSALKVGSHTLSAVYGGNANYDTSTSTTLMETVQLSTSATLLSPSASTLAGGRSLTLTATVNTAGVKATGSVTFTDGGTVLGTTTLTSGAVGTLTLTTLPVGPHSIIATYSGDLNYGASSSPASAVTVTLGNTLLTLAASPTSATSGATITLSASMTSDGVLPSNPGVTLTDNGSTLTALTLSTAGKATFNTSTLSVGTHNIMAQYAGDPNNATAQSQTITVTIIAAKTTTTLTSSGSPSNFGDSVTLQAKVASDTAGLTGSVTFQEGNTILGTSQVSASGIATLTVSNFSVAQHTLVAVYGGDSTHAGSTSAPLTQIVVDPTTVSLSSGTNPAVAGNAVVFTAQVAGTAANSGVTAAPTGTMVFHEGATILGSVALNGLGVATLSISTLSVGTHNVVATYSGDSLYAGNDSAALGETIRSASTQTSLTTSVNPSVYATPLILSVRVTGNGGTPTGTVSFVDGTTTIGQATLVTDGTASFTTSSLAPGLHSLTAVYVGDSSNSMSSSAAVNQQVQQTTQITLASSSNPDLTLDKPTLTATIRNVTGAPATGTVRFLDGSVLLGTATVSGGVATLVPDAFSAGTHGLTASYTGDTADLQSLSPTLALVVNLRTTQNALTATTPTAGTGGILSLISVLKWDGPAVPTGITTFRIGTTVIGTSRVDTSGVATLNVTSSAITGNVVASYSGDAAYTPSDSSPTNVTTIAATNFTLSVTPGNFSVPTKQYVVQQVTLQSINGFSDIISLGCLGLPYAATCTFDHDTVTLPADGTVVVNVTLDTGSPLTSGGESSASAQRPAGNSPALALLPAGALLAWLAFGRKRRTLPVLLMLLLASALLPVVGCGTINIKSTPPGTYAVSISAVGGKTGVTLSQGITMTVTQ